MDQKGSRCAVPVDELELRDSVVFLVALVELVDRAEELFAIPGPGRSA